MDYSFFEDLTEHTMYDNICMAFDSITTNDFSLKMIVSSNIDVNDIKTKIKEILNSTINNINQIEKFDFDFLNFNIDYDLNDTYIDMIENID